MEDTTPSIVPMPAFSITSTPSTDLTDLITTVTSTQRPSATSGPETLATTNGTTEAPTKSKSNDDFDPHVFMGISIVAVAVVAAIVVFCVVFWQRRKKRKKKKPPVLPHPDEMGATNSSNHTVVSFSNSRNASRPGGLSNNTSSSRENVQIVGFKPLERNHNTVISSGLSEGDNDKDTDNVYVNTEVARASAARESKATSGDCGATGVTFPPSQSSEAPRESLYVRPGSCQLPIPPHVVGNQSYCQVDDDGFEGGSIDRSRLDSQKYLRPAELILKLPVMEDFPRKLSEPAAGVSRVRSLSPDKNVDIRWKAKPKVVHSAEAPGRLSSVYVPMVSCGGSQSSSLEIHGSPKSPRLQDISDRKASATATSPKAPPTPCRTMSNQSTYINIANEEENPEKSPTSIPSPGHYEDVTQFHFQRNSSLYMNAEECQIPKSPLKTDEQRNDPDTYAISSFPPSSSPEKETPKSLINSTSPRLDSINDRLVSCDTETLDTKDHSEDDEDATKETHSYVNVAEFQKTPSKTDICEADKASNGKQIPKAVKKPPRNTTKPLKLDSVTKDADKNKGIKLNKSKPPVAQKPNLLAKLAGSKQEAKAAKSSKDTIKQATKPVLINKKGRFQLNPNSSSSTPNLTSPDQGMLVSEHANPFQKAFKPKFSRPGVKRSSSDLSKRPVVNGNPKTLNDVPSQQPSEVGSGLKGLPSNGVCANDVDTQAADIMKSPAESHSKTDCRVSDNKEPSSPLQKTPKFKSSMDELNIGQLDMSELKSKLKKKL